MSLVLFATAQSAPVPPAVPVYELAKPDAQAAMRFGRILNARVLSSGKVLVNDAVSKQVFLLDEQLSHPKVIIGSDSQAYGPMESPLIPYVADSTLFVDRVSRSLLLIDPDGHMVRAIAPARAIDMAQFANYPSGTDTRGSLIYRAFSPQRPVTPEGKLVPPIIADTIAIVRANFETRVLDTITRYKQPLALAMQNAKDINGKPIIKTMLNPWLEVDDWAVLSDGTVAVVRGNDYHVDFFDADKQLTKSARLPFDFRAISAEEKVHLVDSATVADSAGIGTLGTTKVFGEYIPASKLPDYYPSIGTGALKTDLDTNLWILPNTSRQSVAGELVYDVVSNKGAMLYRVRLPKGKAIAALGRNGLVLLMSKNAEGWMIERTRVLK